jgi:hypothetical protein
MADLYHQDHPGVIVNAIDDPIIALSDAILLEARELLATMRPRLRGEALDARDDLPSVFGGERLQLFDGRRLDEQAIACHAASGP